MEAAEAVCAGRGVETSDILDLLTQLVDKSLVVAETQGGAARYRLLETVRQYGRDRLMEVGEAEHARRHRDWFLALAEQADRELRGPRQELWLERFETEHDNLRAALEWSRAEKHGAEAGLRLAGALHRFWVMHGHWSEGRVWTEGAIARSIDTSPSALPKALRGATSFAWRRGDYGLATTLGEKGLALCRELGDKDTNAWLLHDLGIVAYRQGHYTRATALFEESLNLSHELEDKSLIGSELANLGHVARYQGDHERAKAFYTESLALFRAIVGKWEIALALRNLGRVALHQNDYARATAYFAESLILLREMGERWVSEECLEGFAGVASATGHYERAARLIGAADELREILGWYPSPPDQADYDKCGASTRAELGHAAFTAAWAEGRAMTLEQAIEYALAEV